MIVNFSKIISEILQYPEVPHVIQNLGLAFLTILIPFAIAVFTIILQKKEEQKNLQKLNLSVLLDEVFNLKFILIAIIFIFLPFCFWSVSQIIWFKSILVFASSLSIYFIGRTVWKVYRWVKGDEIDYQISYLRRTNNSREVKAVWEDIWRTDEKKLSWRKEKEFLKVFTTKIEKLIENSERGLLGFFINKIRTKKDPEVCEILLQDFLNNISNRSFQGLISIFPKVLKWDSEILNKVYNKEENSFQWDSRVFLPIAAVEEIIRDIIRRGLKSDKRWLVEKMFQELEKYIDKHKEEKINDKFYPEFFFRDNSNILFEKMALCPLGYEICNRYFSSGWKITRENLENSNKVSIAIFNNFIEWTRQRILDNQNVDFDKVLDYDLRCLFPNVSSVYWARILLFIFSSWGDKDYKNKVEYVVKNRKVNFGLGKSSGLIMMFSLNKTNKEEVTKKVEAKRERIMKVKIRNTFELVDFLSYHEENFYFFKKNLEKYITNLRNLEGKFKSESAEEYRRRRYLEVFGSFSEFLKGKNSLK